MESSSTGTPGQLSRLQTASAERGETSRVAAVSQTAEIPEAGGW